MTSGEGVLVIVIAVVFSVRATIWILETFYGLEQKMFYNFKTRKREMKP